MPDLSPLVRWDSAFGAEGIGRLLEVLANRDDVAHPTWVAGNLFPFDPLAGVFSVFVF